MIVARPSRCTWKGRLIVFAKRAPDGPWRGIGPDEARDVRLLRRAMAQGDTADELEGYSWAVSLGPPLRGTAKLAGPLFVQEYGAAYVPTQAVTCYGCGCTMMVAGIVKPDRVVCADCQKLLDAAKGRCAHCGSFQTYWQNPYGGGPATLACSACGGISYPYE